jgi:hypothetical protein
MGVMRNSLKLASGNMGIPRNIRKRSTGRTTISLDQG